MDPFGTTRSRLARDHALIAPESFVRAPLPGWAGTLGITLIAPAMGARFAQYLAEMEPGGTAGSPSPGVERFAFVLDGEVEVELAPGVPHALGPGGFVYVGPSGDVPLRATSAARLCVFDKRYEPLGDHEAPRSRVGDARDVPGTPFLGDPDARLQVFLPDEPGFDMAVNLFTYQPGATLPMVEVHVMEHGLLMLDGQGIYRLGDSWYPVQGGDVIWMASYCPQWFAAIGKAPARYLYYKDVQRDPLAGPLGLLP